MNPEAANNSNSRKRAHLSLLEAGRQLGGLTPAAVCALIVERHLRGVLVNGSLKVARADLRAFVASATLRLLPNPQPEVTR